MGKGANRNNEKYSNLKGFVKKDDYGDIELDYDLDDEDEQNHKGKNLKYRNYDDDNGRKPQWRADRKQAKKLKEQRLGIIDVE